MDRDKTGRITGAKQIIGRFNIPAKCSVCGKNIFLMCLPPNENTTPICVLCSIREINISSEQNPDQVKDMVLSKYMEMQRAGF